MTAESEGHIEATTSEPRFYPSLDEVRELAKEYEVIPIYTTLPADLLTPVSTYIKLAPENSGVEAEGQLRLSFLFESVEGGEKVARYSYIGVFPRGGMVVRNSEIKQFFADGSVAIDQVDETPDPLETLRNKVSKHVAKIEGVPPFYGGHVGYLGYETVSAFEKRVPRTNPDILGIPDSVLLDFDKVVAFDNIRHEIKIIGNIVVDECKDIEQQYSEVTDGISNLVCSVCKPIQEIKTPPDVSKRGELVSNFEKQEYMNLVEKIKDYIVKGDVIQVVISQRFERETDVDPLSLYRALRRVNPSPFMFYMDFGDFQLIGASPELLLRVEDRKLSTWPIAGTRPRGETEEEDMLMEEELKSDEKEKAEHIMLVDLGRNDIGRAAEPGTVSVDRFMDVERFSHVMHLTSEVSGKLRQDFSPLDALRAAFPAGTVSGAPKIRAMEIIDELEREKRGAYAGAVGYVSLNGKLEFAITIRTMVHKDGKVYIQAGGGIVYDSDPETEYQETVNKAKAAVKAIELAEKESEERGGKFY